MICKYDYAAHYELQGILMLFKHSSCGRQGDCMKDKIVLTFMTLVLCGTMLTCPADVTITQQRQELLDDTQARLEAVHAEALQICQMLPDPGNSIRVAALQELRAAQHGVHARYRLTETALNTDAVDDVRVCVHAEQIEHALDLHMQACVAFRNSGYDAIELIGYYDRAHEALQEIDRQTLGLCHQLYAEYAQRRLQE